MLSLLGLDPASYTPSALHGPSRTFRETNCYVDIWIELLHALGIDAASMMSFACTVDFEGDQWTFFKPRPEDLLRLYGIDVHEMQIYRPPVDHIVEQLRAQRTVTIETDSYYLPDTAGISYRRAHVKSSILVEAIDPDAGRLRYFHGAGYHELSGEDYRNLFQFTLPPYIELVRFEAARRLKGVELKDAARDALRRELSCRPSRNPWIAFGERLAADLPHLLQSPDDAYHAYAFATVRQSGAAFECAASFVEWLCDPSCMHGRAAQEALSRQVAGAKALLFKLARRKSFDSAPAIRGLAADWEIAMNALDCVARGAATGAA